MGGGRSWCSLPSTGPMLKRFIGVELQKKIQSQGVVSEAAVQDRGIGRIIGTETIEGEAGAEVGSDIRTDTEIVIIIAIGLAVSVLIMTGNIIDTVALLYVKAPVIAEAVHLIRHLMKEHLASPEMSVLHVLEALEPKHISHMFSWTA